VSGPIVTRVDGALWHGGDRSTDAIQMMVLGRLLPPCAIFRSLETRTGSAEPKPLSDPKVPARKCVTPLARASTAASANHSERVLAKCHDLQVCGVHAEFVPAQMVNGHPRGYRTDSCFVGESVRVDLSMDSIHADARRTVATRPSARPRPALVRPIREARQPLSHRHRLNTHPSNITEGA
jgi:hypothetical protein